MGYLDKTTQTVTAHFTKRGRELLADALAGNTSGDYIITQFALGDDEVDYSLYDESLSPNLRGKVIENMSLLESFINEEELMNYFLKDAPPVMLQSQLSNIPAQITLEGLGDVIDISPITENFTFFNEETQENQDWETYTFTLGHDNMVEMYDINNPPTAEFTYEIDVQGSPPEGTPPNANFNYQNTNLIF